MTDAHARSSDLSRGIGTLLRGLVDNWWLVLLRGIAAIAFGVLAFVWPGPTLVTLALLWGAYALVDGIVALWVAIAGGGGDVGPRWWLAAIGIAGILAGLTAFFWPGITAQALLFFIAGWAIAIGVLQIIGAIRLRKEIEGEWLLILGGAISVVFGAALFTRPEAGALAMVWLIGLYAILAGLSYISAALWLKGFKA